VSDTNTNIVRTAEEQKAGLEELMKDVRAAKAEYETARETGELLAEKRLAFERACAVAKIYSQQMLKIGSSTMQAMSTMFSVDLKERFEKLDKDMTADRSLEHVMPLKESN
jgi:hypothetical protein